MTTVVGRHKVGDFDTWLNGHQDRIDVFSPAVSSFETFRDTDDPNGIVLVMQVNDMERFQEIMEDTSSHHLQDKHTVIRPVTVSMPVDI